MNYWKNYAVISNGKVMDVVVGDAFDCLQSANAIYGSGAFVVLVSNPDIPVSVGDDYDGENFYHDGELVKPFPTESAVLQAVKAKGDNTKIKADNNGTSIIDIENAILELYELIGE